VPGKFPTLAATLVLAGLAAGPSAAASTPAGIGGNWVFHVDWGQLKYDMLCHLADDGGKLTGVCQGFSGSLINAHGAYDAAMLRLNYSTTFMQYDIEVHYQGSRGSGGGVEGSIDAAGTPGIFDGTAPLTMSDNTLMWVLHSQLPGVKPYDLFCALAQDDAKKLSGRCATAGGPVMKPEGSLAGAQVTFSYTTEVSGMPVGSHFTGTYNGDDEIEGTATSDIGGTATFKARRR